MCNYMLLRYTWILINGASIPPKKPKTKFKMGQRTFRYFPDDLPFKKVSLRYLIAQSTTTIVGTSLVLPQKLVEN